MCEFEGTKCIKYMSDEDPLKFVKMKLKDGASCENEVFLNDPHVDSEKTCYIVTEGCEDQVTPNSFSEETHDSEEEET
jgi:hypothetical protein